MKIRKGGSPRKRYGSRVSGKKRTIKSRSKRIPINNSKELPVVIPADVVQSIRQITDDDGVEWGISWEDVDDMENMKILRGGSTSVRFFPDRKVNLHTHHGEVVSYPSSTDVANVLDAKEMVSIITTPYGWHIFKKERDDTRVLYDEAKEITKDWVGDDYRIDNLREKLADYHIGYSYITWEEAENGVDVNKIMDEQYDDYKKTVM